MLDDFWRCDVFAMISDVFQILVQSAVSKLKPSKNALLTRLWYSLSVSDILECFSAYRYAIYN